MLNNLRGDERIRRNYQFWFYSYPSGYPYPYSAAILRHELDAVQKKYPLRKPMIVIGHSMGGCISRLLLTDSKDKLVERLRSSFDANNRVSEAARGDDFLHARRPEHRNGSRCCDVFSRQAGQSRDPCGRTPKDPCH